MSVKESERTQFLQSAIETALHGVEQARRIRPDARLDHAAQTLLTILSESNAEGQREGDSGSGGGADC